MYRVFPFVMTLLLAGCLDEAEPLEFDTGSEESTEFARTSATRVSSAEPASRSAVDLCNTIWKCTVYCHGERHDEEYSLSYSSCATNSESAEQDAGDACQEAGYPGGTTWYEENGCTNTGNACGGECDG